MYRIELSPGEETAFRSIEELAVAIRRKVVTSRARIYHNATSRWLPIQFHPHYKIALSMPLTQADLVAGPPVTPLSALKLGDHQPPATPAASSSREAATQAALAAWPEPKPAAPAPGPLDREAAPVRRGPPPPEPLQFLELGVPAEPRRLAAPERIAAPVRELPRPRVTEPPVWHEPPRASTPRRRRKLQRSLRVALAGAILVAFAHLVVSGATAPSVAVARARTPRQLIQTPANAIREMTPRTVAAVMPVLQSIPVPGITPPSPAATPPAPVTSKDRVKPPAPRATPVTTARIDSAAVSPPAPVIEVAPDADITVGAPLRSEPLMPQVVDSSGKKALKGILRTISGSPASTPQAPKR
jgi:hypothetical protein